MPVRHFEIFAQERRLIHTNSLSHLKDNRLGIDGNTWLRKLLHTSAKEGAPVAMGGPPLQLKKAITRDVESWKKYSIRPLIVFNGLSIVRKDKPFSTDDTRPSKRVNAWEFISRSLVDRALLDFGSTNSIHQPDLVPWVLSLLTEMGVKCMRAPYSAWAQLAYMFAKPRQLVNAVFGSNELLMYDIDKLILSMDFDKGTYTWLSKKDILSDLVVNNDAFMDVCILAGFEWSVTFPVLDSHYSQSFTFKGTLDLINMHRTGFNAVRNFLNHPAVREASYMDTFCRTRCAVKYHLVYTDDGTVAPLNPESSPADTHEFIGYRMPDEIYYYLARGLISSQVLNTLVTGILIEPHPLDNGETTEYRNFLLSLLELRTTALGFLTQPLHPFFHQRRVSSVFWFEPTVEHSMVHGVVWAPGGILETTDSWNAPGYIKGKASLGEVMRAMAEETTLKKSVAPFDGKVLDSREDIIAAVLGRVLEIRGYLSHTHSHTTLGKVLFKAIQGSPIELHESLLTAIELIRFDALHGRPYSKVYEGEEAEIDTMKRNITLVVRVMSLVPMQFKGVAWQTPAPNRDLLVFNSFAKGLNRSLRNLFEMVTLNLFLNGRVRKERDDFIEIEASLPYLTEVNTALGLVMKYYIKEINRTENSIQAFAETMQAFPACVDVDKDLKKGFLFVEKVAEAAESLHEHGIVTKELAKEYMNAWNWVRDIRVV